MKWSDADKQTVANLLLIEPKLTADRAIELAPELRVYGSKGVDRRIYRTLRPDAPRVKVSDSLEQDILKVVRKRSINVAELSSKLDRGVGSIVAAIKSLQEAGHRVDVRFDEVMVPDPVSGLRVKMPQDYLKRGNVVRLGVVSDPHYCNRHSREELVDLAYDTFAEQGIAQVLLPGNWIDGESYFNKVELEVGPGFERQIAHFVDRYPQRDGITTFVLDGYDHEGWYAKREVIEVGRRMVQTARDRGRSDLEYVGAGEADFAFYAEGSKKPAIVRILHPSGGAAYSMSYKPQKIIESYEGGEKPGVLIIGHYHKAGYFTFRNCHCVLAGTLESQTQFMRGKQLAAHVGFWILEFRVMDDGSVAEFNPRFYPFYNEGYYRDLFPIGDLETTRIA